MNASLATAVGALLSAFGIGSLLVAVINNFLSPKTKAETRAIAQKSAQETVDQALANLRSDLADARIQIADARQRADSAEQRADAADAKHDRLLTQYRTLLDHMWRLQVWAQRYYEIGNHPPDMPPPPVLKDFQDGGGAAS